MKTKKHAPVGRLAALALLVAGQLVLVNSAQAAEYRPVIGVGTFMGVFADGQWQDAPGQVTVAGKAVALTEIKKDKALFKKLKKADDGLPCETPLIKKGQKIAYYGTDGQKKHEGAVIGTFLRYEGEASGAAALDVRVEGAQDIDQSALTIGVAAEVMAAPAPTTRSQDAESLAFTCDYQSQKYALKWTPGPDDTYSIAFSLGEKSWPVDSADLSPNSLDDLQCGFFDLDGNGSLELVIYDAGSNGNISLYRFDAEGQPERLAWLYTGEE